MKGALVIFSIGVLALLPNVTLCASVKENGDDSSSEKEDNSKCGLFLAPSSIPNSGLGMFAGHGGISENATIGDGDVIIPFFEMEFHNQLKSKKHRNDFLWDEYVWASHTFPGAEQETEDLEDAEFACPGIGSAANSYLALKNVLDQGVSLGLGTDPGSPGAGAHSPYHNRYFTATEDIPEGGEVWMDYGPAYFKSRVNEYGYIPLPESYPVADDLLIDYQEMRFVDCNSSDISNQTWEELYQTILDFAPIWRTSRVLHALPTNASKIEDILNDGGTTYRDYDASRRDLAWLDEHGQCMDNIKTGMMSQESPHAGRGALANRFIPAGGLVTPAPLIHIGDMDELKMYQRTTIKKARFESKVVPDMNGPTTYQLILNYCFGHMDSTLLLCPYGLLTALINHSSKNANTRIVWSDAMRRKEWLEEPIDEFADESIAGLQFDFVALRDIQEDEEILIDYGDEWEQAWQEHMQNHQPRDGYIPAFELNQRLNEIEFRTLDERPYSDDGIQLRCRIQHARQCFSPRSEHLKKDSIACAIIEKLGENKYTVKVLEDGVDDDLQLEMPADAFFFVDLPYQRHHFSFQAFRHAMMIPDDMFPDVWKSRTGDDKREAGSQEQDEEDSSDDGEDEVFVDEEEDASAFKRKPKGWKHDDSAIIELPEA
ncbi:unnamed protein product [Cylindrotheca closterium]|uniref:SET domain-containing protein n=1 Tax=Cylindrotheca closterium TaxID=2856 RepID=A0AAD2JKH2_9STRA|nr:unnamed protein product [Cylindrotheca closterium]